MPDDGAQMQITHYTAEHGEKIKEWGAAHRKRPNVVYLFQPGNEGTVETNEGTLDYHRGDFIAFDPLSGHVWPIAPNYVAMHYELMPEVE